MADEGDTTKEFQGTIIDCHAHLVAKEFDEDIGDVITAAQKCGVKAVVVVSEFKREFQRVLTLAEMYPNVIAPCLGIHPTQSLSPDRCVVLEDLEGVQEIIKDNHEKLVGVGEIGLDFTPRFAKCAEDKEIQKEVFRRQIKWAQELDLPINVHSRSAGRVAVQLMKEQGVKKAVLHAFDGRPSVALQGVQEGFYFSIPPSVVRSEQKQKLVKQVPLSNLLLETDSPALAAEKQTRNEPKNIWTSCEAISIIKGIPEETVFEETTKNALKLFPKLQRFMS